MTANAPDPERRLLPRWRTAAAAVASGELKTAPPAKPAIVGGSIHFDSLLATWRSEPTIETAAELVASAVVLGRTAEVEPAARLLADEGADSTPLLRELSRHALAGPLARQPERVPLEFATNVTTLHAAVAEAKQRTQRSPKNPIPWMDLAHAQTVLGQQDKARRAVRIALILAPENRFILRSATRFFVHAHDNEQALAMLRRSRAVRNDPWIMAAELALSTVVRQHPHAYKHARQLADADDLEPWHTAELHGALGTLALLDRGVGKARKFFNRSLRKPTENALAQAQWAATSHSAVEVPTQLLSVDRAFEAIALKARGERRWRDALKACRCWSAMEPTSTRPLLFAGFIAEVALGDGIAAREFTSRLLITAPNDPIALNNHIVALAYAGELADAKVEFEHLAKRTVSPHSQVVRRATEGLLAFRGGDREHGGRLYLEAFERATALKDRELQALVLWHLLREEAHAGVTGIEPVVKELWDKTQDLALPELITMRDGILASAAAAARNRSVVLPSALPHIPLPPGYLLHLVGQEREEH